MEILEAARCASFDPNSAFRMKLGYSPWDLFQIKDVFRTGFVNFIEAKPIAPPTDNPVFLRFTSARTVPTIGDFLSLDENCENVSVFDGERLESFKFKSTLITSDEYESERRKAYLST